MPKVLNIMHLLDHKIPADAVYIGRAYPKFNLTESIWCNPFPLRKGATDIERHECIMKYKQYLLNYPELLRLLPLIKGKDLVCFCAPKECHGDVLIQLANS